MMMLRFTIPSRLGILIVIGVSEIVNMLSALESSVKKAGVWKGMTDGVGALC